MSRKIRNLSSAMGSADASTAPGAAKRFELAAEHELRFEIPADCTTATLTLETGAAELFGVELARANSYALSAGATAAVFTWHGATLALQTPEAALAYTATDTPMPTYLSAHAVLQARRDAARAAGIAGPRAVVVGPVDCGKTALVRMLAAYAVKAGGSIVLVDLDPAGSGAVPVMPGACAISVVEHLDVDAGGPVHDRVASVMLGNTSPRDNLPLTTKLFETMGSLLDGLLSEPANSPHMGAIVDTSGDIDGSHGPESVLAAVKAMRADVVFVLGAERLYASVRNQLNGFATEVVLLPKSGGVVSRLPAARMAARSRLVKRYFYGADNRLSPFTTNLDFSQVVVLKVGGASANIPDSVLPIGAESTLDPLKPTVMPLSRELLHTVLAVSQATEEDQVLAVPVFGYIHVAKVDTERNTITVLAPSPGRVPSRFLLAGTTKWIE